MENKLKIFLSRDKQQLGSIIYDARCEGSSIILPGGYGIEDTEYAVRGFIYEAIPIFNRYVKKFPDIFLNHPTIEFIVEE